MRTLRWVFAVVSMLACTPALQAAPKAQESESAAEPTVEEQTEDKWLVILGVYKDFPEAKADAVKFSKAAKVPFTLRGMVFDKKGLRLPDNDEDEVWAGQYALRRYNATTIKGRDVENHFSVEKSEAYEGLVPGFYIIVGQISDSARDAKEQVQQFLPVSKITYAKKTRIYMGCMH